MKKILFPITVVIFTLTAVSCTNYIKPIHTEPLPNAENITKKLSFKEGSISMNFYADYIFDKTDRKFIFFTNREISNILKSIKAKPSSQILFTYTPSSIYNNMLGFYYSGKKLQDIKTELSSKKPDKQMENALIYTYQYRGHDIIDIYMQEEKGIIRLVALNNPEKQNSDKFELENDKLLFDLNPDFWTRQ
ncbi:hypothetical protein [Chryseobacterium sp. Mn2064]|uniref:hypothetical protein n=1 Tax=Chryseobacterium sp. Mn2064 TaxID=3395263 RepID=UPI003BD06E7F